MLVEFIQMIYSSYLLSFFVFSVAILTSFRRLLTSFRCLLISFRRLLTSFRHLLRGFLFLKLEKNIS